MQDLGCIIGKKYNFSWTPDTYYDGIFFFVYPLLLQQVPKFWGWVRYPYLLHLYYPDAVVLFLDAVDISIQPTTTSRDHFVRPAAIHSFLLLL